MNPGPVERRLAAILFTDIVGYTALMAESEERGLRARERHRHLVRPLVEQHGGESIEARGDESLSIFPTALDAVRCALAIQDRIADDPELRLHLGIHLGDVVVQDGEVSGDGVNIAARLCALSEGGGLLVSGEVYQAVRNHPVLEARPLGEHRLKNVGRRVSVYALGAPGTLGVWGGRRDTRRLPAPLLRGVGVLALGALAVAGWYLWNGGDPTSPPIRSIAVLPLENLSGDPEQEYFVAGMHEALISSLARIGTGLRVISRTSSVQIARQGKTIPQIAADLGVDGVIEGSAMREKNQVRVIVQLIDARSDDHIWAQSYDREFSSALALTREISRSVAEQVRLVLSPERERLLSDSRSIDSQALDLYLSGVQHRNRLTLPDGQRAIELFEASIAADPSFARAHEGLARAYWVLIFNLWTISPEEALPKMRDAASRALELDATLAEAHALAAQSRWYMEFDWAETEAWLSRALALEPMNVHVIRDLAQFLRFSGRIEEGLALSKRAVAVDPMNPGIRADYGWSFFDARQFPRVIEEANRILERDPSFAEAHELLGASSWFLGDPQAANISWHRYEELEGRPAWYLEAAERGYEEDGVRGRFTELLTAIREHDDGRISHAVRAMMACGAEEPEEALVELNHALRRRDPFIVVIGVSPWYDCVRSDPRFWELLRKINWPGFDG